MEALVAERETNGPFKDLFDLAERLDPKLMNKRQLEQLASAGAFDSLIPDRARAHGSAEIMMRLAQMITQERESNQVSLFGGDMANVIDRPAIPIVKQWTDTEQLQYERKAVGFYISAHPLDAYDAVIERERLIPASEVFSDAGMVGQTVKMAGAIISYREATSKNTGRKFGSLSLSDRTDAFELMIFEDDLPGVRMLVEDGAPIVATVQIRKREDDDMVRLSSRGLESLEQVSSESAKGLLVEVDKPEAFGGVKAALSRKTGGKGRVTIRVPVEERKRYAEFRLEGRYKVTPELKQAITAEIGVAYVEEV